MLHPSYLHPKIVMEKQITVKRVFKVRQRENAWRMKNKSICASSEPGHELLKNTSSLLDPRIYNRPCTSGRATLLVPVCPPVELF